MSNAFHALCDFVQLAGNCCDRPATKVVHGKYHVCERHAGARPEHFDVDDDD